MQLNLSLKPAFSAFEKYQKAWGWFLAFGIFLIFLGCVAVFAAGIATLFTVFFLGSVLIISGILKILYACWAREWSGFFLSLLLGVIYGIIGVIFLAKPVAAAAALTMLIGCLFVIGGIFKIGAVFMAHFEKSGFTLLSGIVSLILGILVLAEWPQASLWIIGLFIGIDLIFFGWTWVMLAIAAKAALKKVS